MRLDYGSAPQQTPQQLRPPLQSQLQQWLPRPRQSPRSLSRLGPARTRLPRQASAVTTANAPPEHSIPQHSPPQQSRLHPRRSLPRSIPMQQSLGLNSRASETEFFTVTMGSATSESSIMSSPATSWQQISSQQDSQGQTSSQLDRPEEPRSE